LKLSLPEPVEGNIPAENLLRQAQVAMNCVTPKFTRFFINRTNLTFKMDRLFSAKHQPADKTGAVHLPHVLP
jgi:hypothetical protein